MIEIEEGKSYITNSGAVRRNARRIYEGPFAWALDDEDGNTLTYTRTGTHMVFSDGLFPMDLAREYVEPKAEPAPARGVRIEEGKSYVTNCGLVLHNAEKRPHKQYIWRLLDGNGRLFSFTDRGHHLAGGDGSGQMDLAREYVEPEALTNTPRPGEPADARVRVWSNGPAPEEISVDKIETGYAGIAAETFGPLTFYPDDNPKTVMGLAKPGTAAIPPIAILQLGQAMHNGEVKYGRSNWRDKTVTTSVYTDAIDRHMLAFRDGEDCAEDSGLSHLAHVMACCAILMDAAAVGKLNDDRRRDGPTAEFIKRNTKGLDVPAVSDK